MNNNREIKFRVWSKSCKSFCENFHFSGFLDELFEDDPELVFQQFTGIYDESGWPIFEGDIVEYYFYTAISRDEKSPDKSIDEVKYSKLGEWCLGKMTIGMLLSFVYMNRIGKNTAELDIEEAIQKLRLRIIGTVFENPELLN